jgi:hypothetical protein
MSKRDRMSDANAKKEMDMLHQFVIKRAAITLAGDARFCDRLVVEIKKRAFHDADEKITIIYGDVRKAVLKAAGLEVIK